MMVVPCRLAIAQLQTFGQTRRLNNVELRFDFRLLLTVPCAVPNVLSAAAPAADQKARLSPKKFLGARWQRTTFIPPDISMLLAPPSHAFGLRTVVTIDASGPDAREVAIGERPNPMTDPFFIDGAEPGDTLAVPIDRLTPRTISPLALTVLATFR